MEHSRSFDTDTPIYLQIADDIERQVRCGALAPGERLPAERTVCEQLGVARGTVKSAFRELERRGTLEIRPNSGAYICELQQDLLQEEIHRLLTGLHKQGLSKWEVAMMAKEAAWSELASNEQIQVAWVDCSPELFRPVARQIEAECHVAVTPFLLDDLVRTPSMLADKGFDLIATTINHYEELEPLAALQEYAGVGFERLVLSMSRPVVSAAAGIESRDSIAVFYDSAMYRRSVEMFLVEFGAKARYHYYPMRYGTGSFTDRLQEWNLVIVPPDPEYMGNLPADIASICQKNGIRILRFENIIDYGSLQYLKERAQRCWLEKSDAAMH